MKPQLALFLATSGHSGVDRVMANLMGELAARGLRVDILKIAGHGPYVDPSSSNVKIVNLGTSHVNTSLLPLVHYLRRAQPQALLSDKDRVNRLALGAKKLAGVPTRVVVRLGTTVSQNLQMRSAWTRWFQYGSMRWLYPWADGIIVPSQGAARDLARFARLSPKRIRVVPSPIASETMMELAAEPAEHPWFRTEGPPVILGVGELSARKSFATLIKAFGVVRQQRASRLLIIGEGRQRPLLKRLAQELGVDSEVSLPGFVANPYAYMSKASMLVHPSICEGAPVVLVEALALGLPVVSTDCRSGPREILQDGRFGPLVPVGDVDAMAKAIIAVLDNHPEPDFLQSAALPYTVAAGASRYLEVLGLSG